MAIATKALSPALGLEILGADIAAGMTESDFEAIERAWFDTGLICLRGQSIDDDQQVAFGARFGAPAPWSRFADTVADAKSRNPYLMLISNIKENGEYIGSLAEGEIEFHSDGIYIEEPLAATMLYCVTPTLHGGETAFASMYKAYESLPDALKARLDGLKALHAFTYNTTRVAVNEERKRDWSGVAHYVHPVVRTHPVTGRRALYVNRLMTQDIVGLDPAESRDILETLYAAIENPAHVYEHRWRAGDVLLWDNRCLAHARRDFPPHETRMMKRLTIKGDRPF